MEQPRLARRQRYSFIRRFRAKSSDMWSTRSLNFFNNDRQLAFACGTSPLRMFRYSKGRYRSGQTGQTVNLLALRLRWFESSPAQFPNGLSRALSSAHGDQSAASANPLGADSTARMWRQACCLITTSSLATVTPATVSAAAI